MPRSKDGRWKRACVVCGHEFQARKDSHVTCSVVCRNRLPNPGRDSSGGHKPEAGLSERSCVICGSYFRPYRAACVTCSRKCRRAVDAEEKNRARRIGEASDPEARRSINRRSNYKRYGLTSEQVEAVVVAQLNLCAICNRPPSGTGHCSKLHVDHDHFTGKFRAMLCDKCNRGLGYFSESAELLREAALYLERHKEAT